MWKIWSPLSPGNIHSQLRHWNKPGVSEKLYATMFQYLPKLDLAERCTKHITATQGTRKSAQPCSERSTSSLTLTVQHTAAALVSPGAAANTHSKFKTVCWAWRTTLNYCASTHTYIYARRNTYLRQKLSVRTALLFSFCTFHCFQMGIAVLKFTANTNEHNQREYGNKTTRDCKYPRGHFLLLLLTNNGLKRAVDSFLCHFCKQQLIVRPL